jgi:hypothetical protein
MGTTTYLIEVQLSRRHSIVPAISISISWIFYSELQKIEQFESIYKTPMVLPCVVLICLDIATTNDTKRTASHMLDQNLQKTLIW